MIAAAITPTNMGTCGSTPKMMIPTASAAIRIASVNRASHSLGILFSLLIVLPTFRNFGGRFAICMDIYAFILA